MKSKLVSLLAGAVLLVTPLTTQLAQAQSAPDLPILAGVTLTQRQENQLTQIRLRSRQQVEQILTDEQVKQLMAIMQQGGGLRQAIAAINLSADQKAQLKQVFEVTRKDMANTLTPEQKQQLKQNLRQQIMQRRQSF